MLTLIKQAPIFVTRRDWQDDDYMLEPSTIIRPIGQASNGAQRVEVMVGKYEGMRGNIPMCFCAPDVMVVTQ